MAAVAGYLFVPCLARGVSLSAPRPRVSPHRARQMALLAKRAVCSLSIWGY